MAASFTVSPILGDVPATSSIAVFTVRNHGSDELPFQVQAFAWTQPGGTDARAPASDLLVVPPVATIPPGESQLVRIALRDQDRSREHAYRVVIRELPRTRDDTGGFALETLVAFDVPLFFAPTSGSRELSWRVARDRDGGLLIHANNTGSRYARFDKLRLLDGKGREIAAEPGPLYILAGARRSWTIPADRTAGLARGTPLSLVLVDTGQENAVPLKIE